MYKLGVGDVIGGRKGVGSTGAAIVNPSPALFGTLQDIQVDFKRTLKKLMGQYQFPVDIAAGEFDITGKAKFANLNGNMFNSLFFVQTLTAATTDDMARTE